MKAAIKTTFPDTDIKQYAGGNLRKYMAQWLYLGGIPRHVIADIGGWKLSQRDAMDGYHSASYTQVLSVKNDIEQRVAVAEVRTIPLPVFQRDAAVLPGEAMLRDYAASRPIAGQPRIPVYRL